MVLSLCAQLNIWLLLGERGTANCPAVFLMNEKDTKIKMSKKKGQNEQPKSAEEGNGIRKR